MAVEIKASPELEAIARRSFRAIERRDSASLHNLVSGADAVSFVGTADSEVWRGPAVRDGLGEHFGEVPEFSVRDFHVEAWEAGDAGWSFYDWTLVRPGRSETARLRVTLVFAMEDGAWKIVHRHASVPSPNVAVHGGDHHVLNDLLKAVRTMDPQVDGSGSASVMFTDIADSSAIAETIGDARWTRTMQAHVALLRQAIESRGGTLIKSLGDGSMSTFASAGQAMQAALDIQASMAAQDEEPRLQLRIGLHTGDVVQADGDFFGTVVNKAARIAALARPGDIRVSEATRIMVGGAAGFTFSDAARVVLKGLAGEHLIYRLER